MRTLRLTVGCAVMALVWAAGMAQAATEAAVRKEMTALYNQFAKDFKAKNTRALTARLTSDFQMKTPEGQTLNRQQAVATMTGMMNSVKRVKSYSYKFDKIVPKGNTALVTVTEKYSLVVADPQGGEHSLDGTGQSRETFVKTGKGWRLKRSEGLKNSLTLDGQPFQGG